MRIQVRTYTSLREININVRGTWEEFVLVRELAEALKSLSCSDVPKDVQEFVLEDCLETIKERVATTKKILGR